MALEILGVEMYSMEETAKLLGVTVQTIRSYVRKGSLPTPTMIGRKKYFSTEILREFLTKTKE